MIYESCYRACERGQVCHRASVAYCYTYTVRPYGYRCHEFREDCEQVSASLYFTPSTCGEFR